MARSLSFILALILFSFVATVMTGAGADVLPTGISTPDQADARVEILKTIGFGSNSKVLGDPYPLGGYSGLEVGLSRESISIGNIARLGNQTGPQNTLSYSRLMIGKGVYNNIDFFLHFIPFADDKNISGYGGMAKWTFYQASTIPFTLSAVVHGNSTNVSNQLVTQSTGAFLLAGMTFDKASVYLGQGRMSTYGQFHGADFPDVTVSERVDDYHYFIGGSMRFEPMFVALQFDQVQQPVISARLGVRY